MSKVTCLRQLYLCKQKNIVKHLFKFLGTNRGTWIFLLVFFVIVSVGVWAIRNDRPLTVGPVEIGNKPALPVKDTSQIINGDQFGTVNGDVIKDHGVKNVFTSRKDTIRPK